MIMNIIFEYRALFECLVEKYGYSTSPFKKKAPERAYREVYHSSFLDATTNSGLTANRRRDRYLCPSTPVRISVRASLRIAVGNYLISYVTVTFEVILFSPGETFGAATPPASAFISIEAEYCRG